MNSFNQPIGLYVHIPFCGRKCPYCDFYSTAADAAKINEYVAVLCRQITQCGEHIHRKADTLYFGGGTPSLIGAKRLSEIKAAAENAFILDKAEITAEINPAKQDFDFSHLYRSGFNRVSIGLQSANDEELALLGRLHNSAQADRCIKRAQQAGFDNISLDLMIATPQQTKESLLRSLAFCASHNVQHISAYLLKIEEGTPYFQKRSTLALPDEDAQAEMYLLVCEKLREYGFEQYEISNFAKPGFESRHNLKYWHDEEYIGFGPSAHSFVKGRRYYCERSFECFYTDQKRDDGIGGNIEEWIMLGLRLTEGINNKRFREHFGMDIPRKYFDRARKLESYGLVRTDEQSIRLTIQGFLVSNAVIAEVLR